MNDAVTHDLLQHEAAQAKAESAYEANAPKALESLVDDIMGGRVIRYMARQLSLNSFIEDVNDVLDYEQCAILLTGDRDAREAVIERAQKAATDQVRAWLEDSALGQEIVADRVNEIEAQAREDAAA